MDIITDEKTGESLSEALTELLRDKGDKVKEKIIAVYGTNPRGRENLIEIMSRTSRDDRITEILCDDTTFIAPTPFKHIKNVKITVIIVNIL